MTHKFGSLFRLRAPSPLWNDKRPVRDELFGAERLEQHAHTLASAQPVTSTPPKVISLHDRLNANANVLLAAYRDSAAELEKGRDVVPAAEWLLDNYHLVAAQIREIREDLPPRYYRQLPKLAEGPFAGYPRVLGLAWGYIAHTDSHFDPFTLRRFINSYQKVQPLTIGELWAVAITLRIVLIENLRRLADQITAGRIARAEAEALANRLLASGDAQRALGKDIVTRDTGPLSVPFAAQLVKRLRDQDPRTTPALGWLEDRLSEQGTTTELVVQEAQQRLGASNVSVRNVITSMRMISDIDWAELFEEVSLVDHCLSAGSNFNAMDFPTRNLYRSAIEQLARGAPCTEIEIAERVVTMADEAAEATNDEVLKERLADPGYHLITEGRLALEKSIGYQPPFWLRVNRLTMSVGIGGYVGAIVLVTALLLAAGLAWLNSSAITAIGLLVFALLAFIPLSEAATALVNRMIAWRFGASPLPALELLEGVATNQRTLVVVPSLLISEEEIIEQVRQLEVHYLGGASGDLTFALLTDGLDADSETLPGDAALIDTAIKAIDALNLQYGPGIAGQRFLLLHRRRQFNPAENVWMGWERKRGKLHELNRLLRGAKDTSYMALNQQLPWVPEAVRYVITLDADTRLPRDVALKLIGKMSHPLNRPMWDEKRERIIDGYAILQPRITPSLPIGREGSIYQRIFSGPGGMDPYAAAVSDVYQDLFGEGSYTGKGIYDVDAFEQALHDRIPPNTLLSHDLFEGVFARAGLASDVEVVESSPARYDVIAKRQHRWTRGDWQLLPWILGVRKKSGILPCVGRWKMVDNLRRSLLAVTCLLMLIYSWLLPLPLALKGSALVLLAIAVPVYLPSFWAFFPKFFAWVTHQKHVRFGNPLQTLWADVTLSSAQIALMVTFLADWTWRMLDAIGRTLVRLTISHKRMLEWTTAAQTSGSPRPGLSGYYRQMLPGMLLGLLLGSGALFVQPGNWPLITPVVLLWLFAPLVAWWTSREPKVAIHDDVSDEDAQELRLIGRRTWRFFETFVTPAENYLPPDNFQEQPKPIVAHRTSPTNMGLYLLSAVTARDFGWAGTLQTIERLENTLASMGKLQRFNGHFLNWYATQTCDALMPAYVSSVDSGNLAGHLIALANACEEWKDSEPAPLQPAMTDHLILIQQALLEHSGSHAETFIELLAEIETLMVGAQNRVALLPSLKRLVEKAQRQASAMLPLMENEPTPELLYWIAALKNMLTGLLEDVSLSDRGIQERNRRVDVIAGTARDMAMTMNFRFLVDPERKLLSIGYSLAENQLDSSCYDLLASEARLASLFAIAKGDISTRHWFRLGRTATRVGKGSALISWSGSMFEYLMPSLVMRAPAGSLLEQTNRRVVAYQQVYGHSLGIPWGVSESAYNARDMEFTYQYSNFGVPGLGLKRGLAENIVIAPYATGLATMVDPQGAAKNYRKLTEIGAAGVFGFFEALDFTRSRLPENESVAIVRSYMAHHQGMTLVAIANTLLDGRMRSRFHREAIIQASELLLQECVPTNAPFAPPPSEEVKAAAIGRNETATLRRFTFTPPGAPVTHLLSNGRYAVMLTTSGAGYSRWRDIAVTRWREDSTRDDWGSFILLRDLRSGRIWSAGAQTPVANASPSDFNQTQTTHSLLPRRRANNSDVIFGEDHAAFIRREGTLTTTMEVLVSGEDDGEVRRVTLTNSGRRAREVDLTSYAEVVLTSTSADTAHTAFSRLFVQTEYLPEFAALIASRRTRTPQEKPVWAGHFTVVEGQGIGDVQYETDRSRFIGHGRSATGADAITQHLPLSNTVGTVLDPIFSLRRRLKIAPGKTIRVSFWTLVASSRNELLELIDKHHDRSSFGRAKTLAWTQAQVQLRHLDVKAEEAADFQRLAAAVIYADSRFRAPSDAIINGAGLQSGLWPLSISGDLPIVLLRIDDIQDIAQVRQLLRAHEYWRMKLLSADLVIINERSSSYIQDLQIAIETAVRSSQSRPRFGGDTTEGKVYTLRADLMTSESRALLRSVARVALIARRGPIASQLRLMPSPGKQVTASLPVLTGQPAATEVPADLEFFNGLGGFDKQGQEYVTVLDARNATPAPWINVIANPEFGFQVSAQGSGYTWAENSRENQITPWGNDPVVDAGGEALYVFDKDSGVLWSPTAQPIHDGGCYIARHGFGYSHFAHKANDISLELLQYIPLTDPIKISRLTLHNQSTVTRTLTITAYAEWVLGTSRSSSSPYIITSRDEETGALLARNPWAGNFPGRVAFSDLRGLQTAYTSDRTEFLGRNGGMNAPAALLSNAPLQGYNGAGRDPCAVLQTELTLAAGERAEIVWLFGESINEETSRALIAKYRLADLDQVLEEVKAHWRDVLGAVQVKTPDRAMDIMLNGWLLYQTRACRIKARCGFYQASGAYGFRDQLQDGMALTFSRPQDTREHLLRAAGRQFPQGDVQHWWLPHTGQGVRTRISDDRVWLSFATATYIRCSHDEQVLEQQIPFLDGPRLTDEEDDAFFQPMRSDESATLFEHCARGLDQCVELTGQHGLPLIGSGDWNDGMNRVGEGGKGESVWLGWLWIRTIALFAPLAETRDPERAARWRKHAESVRQAIEQKAWDGAWYRRATFDDGSWLGSSANDECRIDAIAQSWSVLSGAANPERAAMAMASLEEMLIRWDDGLALLFTPPFDKTAHDPGYIKGYPPGLRENGGQYTHAAMWSILAFVELGMGSKAWDLFALLNPINHARTSQQVGRYKVEPYVIAADVYSVTPHDGRGGWTWYTGSAGWMYRAGVEGILGISRQGNILHLNPCLPPAWPGFEATINVEGTQYAIIVENNAHKGTGEKQVMLNGVAVDSQGKGIEVTLDGGTHNLLICI
jgi:cyclic beta-1,2-glucan synthetase